MTVGRKGRGVARKSKDIIHFVLMSFFGSETDMKKGNNDKLK